MVTVQRVFRAKYAKDPPTDKTIRACYKQFTETGCLCKQKSSGRPLTAEDDGEQVRASFLHSANISSCHKRTFSVSCGCEQFQLDTSFGFLVTNVCNHGEFYETPCIYIYIYIYMGLGVA